MKDFSAVGLLVVQIAANAVEDASQNKNIETPITTALTIKSPGINGVPTNDSGASYSDATKDSMFEFTHDGHTEYRYIGNTEKNYVNLIGGDEGKTNANLWRIIGVFDDPSATESGTTGAKKIKLILDEKLNNTNYSWDNNGSNGSNNWNRPAALKTALNQTFWNASSGSCPSGANGATTSCNFTSYKINSVQDKIENMKWYLGGVDRNYSTYSTEKFYQLERGSTATGLVGLPYPSDYGYTFANGVDTICYNTPASCSNGTPKNSWLYKGGRYWWLQTPYSDSDYRPLYIDYYGSLGSNGRAKDPRDVHPVVYLKSNIGITGGEGTKTEPFTVGE